MKRLQFSGAAFAMMVCLLVALLPWTALAQEESDWELNLAPFYLWAISIEGDVGIGGKTTGASVDFSDIWDNLEGVVTLRFNGFYRKKIGFLFDYSYLDLGTERVDDTANAEVGFTSQILNLAGFYRFLDGRHKMDVAAGLRYTKMETEMAFRNAGINLDGDENWVDPIIGIAYDRLLTDKWTLRLYGDIGGFGMASDFTWQGLLLLSYQPWKNVAFVAGYRGIGSDYESGSGSSKFVYDGTTHGPLIGLDIRF